MKHHLPPPEQMSDLVGLVYACAVDHAKMPELLSLLAKYLRGSCVQIYTTHLGSGVILGSHVSNTDPALEDVNQRYVSRWYAVDPRAKLLATLPAGSVLRCHEHFDEAFVGADAFYQDFFIPSGFRWGIAGKFQSGPDTVTVVSAARAFGTQPFEDWTAEALRHLLPHFSRAHLIGTKLDRQAAAVQSTMEMLALLPTPCLVTDQAGRCIEPNQAFQHSVERLSLHLVTGRVRFDNPASQLQWETALFETHATGLGRTVQVTTGAKLCNIRLTPWDPLIEQGEVLDRKMILAVFDEKHPEAQANPELATYTGRLTRAELEVLAGMLKGQPAKTIASSRGASVNTVRSQIMNILEKTGFKSQKELMATFGNSSFSESNFTSSTFQTSSTFHL